MFSILDRATRLCDGISRRELLQIGGLTSVGLTLPSLMRAAESASQSAVGDATFGRAKSVIYVWLQGGPPQHETFDPKPHAPAEIRGPFKSIQTNIPGIDFCELLPRTARMADKLAVVRSMATDSNIHSASAYEVLTGTKYEGPNPRTIMPEDWPYFGSLVKRLDAGDRSRPLSSVWLPDIMRLNENVTPAGQTAGFLGRQWDPDRFVGNPADSDYRVEGMQPTIPPMRLSSRLSLLDQVQSHFDSHRPGAAGVYDRFQEQAIDLLTSDRVQQAFHVRGEPEEVRRRYGMNKWGQCLLLARRLVESGVKLVHVNWTREPGDSAVDNPMWDTHAQNADRLEDVLCPMFDVGFTALMDDLDQRGLLDETLVVAIGEFGRTPRINGAGGRDHWGSVFSFALAGAGITTGQVYGASDSDGAYPARDRVTPADLNATIFHLLGTPHDTVFHDPQGRERRLTTGRPIEGILGGGTATDRRATPGGQIASVPAYSQALLTHTGFHSDVRIRPSSFGSRPKGWRASPLIEPEQAVSAGVRLMPKSTKPNASGAAYAALGFELSPEQPKLSLGKGEQILLAQEIRNPRAGRFRLRVRAGGHATDSATWTRFSSELFQFRLEMFRFRELTKDPTRRQTLAAQPIAPAFSTADDPVLEWFPFEALLDSAGPGLNFSIGNGLGIAIVLERTSAEAIELPADTNRLFAHLRIEEVELEFIARTINDDVQV